MLAGSGFSSNAISCSQKAPSAHRLAAEARQKNQRERNHRGHEVGHGYPAKGYHGPVDRPGNRAAPSFAGSNDKVTHTRPSRPSGTGQASRTNSLGCITKVLRTFPTQKTRWSAPRLTSWDQKKGQPHLEQQKLPYWPTGLTARYGNSRPARPLPAAHPLSVASTRLEQYHFGINLRGPAEGEASRSRVDELSTRGGSQRVHI